MNCKSTLLALVTGALLSMPALAHKYNSDENQTCTNRDGTNTECPDDLSFVGKGKVIKCKTDNPGNPQNGTWQSVYPEKQSDGTHAVNRHGKAQPRHTHDCIARCYIGHQEVTYKVQYWQSFKCPVTDSDTLRN
ncbi:MAG: hypothetical protein OXD44_11425 [Gammaproteobacteria bacterium]|nr:hypothetical protein [Gammaproteobacteria bacterium]MCY4314278.1 hypothetical protein [Gammaproteobacteria bacterium]